MVQYEGVGSGVVPVLVNARRARFGIIIYIIGVVIIRRALCMQGLRLRVLQLLAWAGRRHGAANGVGDLASVSVA